MNYTVYCNNKKYEYPAYGSWIEYEDQFEAYAWDFCKSNVVTESEYIFSISLPTGEGASFRVTHEFEQDLGETVLITRMKCLSVELLGSTSEEPEDLEKE